MADVVNNALVVGYKDTKEVLTFVFNLIKAIRASQADGVVDWKDSFLFTPVIFSIGAAIENIENVQIELRMNSIEQGEELKAWVKTQVEGLETDEEITALIQKSFAVIFDLWTLIKTYFIKTITNENTATDTTTTADAATATEGSVE